MKNILLKRSIYKNVLSIMKTMELQKCGVIMDNQDWDMLKSKIENIIRRING